MDKEGMMRDAVRRTRLVLAWCRTIMVIGVSITLGTVLTDDWAMSFYLWFAGGTMFFSAFAVGAMSVISLADLRTDIAWDEYQKRDRYK